jgi:hypothetical protein
MKQNLWESDIRSALYTFNGIRRFITVFPTARPWTLPWVRWWIQWHYVSLRSTLMFKVKSKTLWNISWHDTFLRWRDEQFVFEHLLIYGLPSKYETVGIIAGEESDNVEVWAVPEDYDTLIQTASLLYWGGWGNNQRGRRYEVTVQLG